MATLPEQRREVDHFFQKVFEKAAGGQPEIIRKAAGAIEPRDVARLPGWPEPDVRTKALSDRTVARARSHVPRGAETLGLTSVYTGFTGYPEARLEFSDGATPDFAPLLATCLDAVLFDGLAHVMAHAHSPWTRRRKRQVDGEEVRTDLYPGEAGRALLKGANQFLLTEISLWSLARDGGFEGVVPYTVRYEAARYLWSPQIAGSAFCLRCGEPIHYRRAAREGARSAPICATCIRGGSLEWPVHAVAPEERGTWWLRCLAQGCAKVFVGRAQARRCPACRTSRRAVSKRTPLVSMPNG